MAPNLKTFSILKFGARKLQVFRLSSMSFFRPSKHTLKVKFSFTFFHLRKNIFFFCELNCQAALHGTVRAHSLDMLCQIDEPDRERLSGYV